MPNKRAASQTVIVFACNRDLVQAMDEACQIEGDGRSLFIRKAMAEELRRRGHKVSPQWIFSAARAGKASRRRTDYPGGRPAGLELKDRSKSTEWRAPSGGSKEEVLADVLRLEKRGTPRRRGRGQ